MTSRFFLRRDGSAIEPATADDAHALFAACPDETEIMVEVVAKGARNVARHRLYWALCALVADNHAETTGRDAVSDALKVLAGHFEPCKISLPGGDAIWLKRPKSISFAKMGEDEFSTYINACFSLIGEFLLPGVDVDDLRKEAYARAKIAQP